MSIPELNNLIKAIECNKAQNNTFDCDCQHCQFGYNYVDDISDVQFYACDEVRLFDDALHYLKLYQYLAEGKNY